LFAIASHAQIRAGAYYFDGWSGQTDKLHLPARLTTEFFDREPIWGWHANTQAIMEQQIDLAADHGLSFFAFDWYWPSDTDNKTTPLNKALELYLKAQNKSRLGFCLLVANHGGYQLTPRDWPAICNTWIKLFHDPQHVTVDGKPLIILFAHGDMRKQFGSSEAVKKAWDELREKAIASGLKGVTVAVVCAPGPENGWADLNQLAAEGYDVFTGYNYHGYPRKGAEQIQRFATMIEGHEQIWNRFAQKNIKPYIPVVTAGWDPRAWQPPEKANDPSGYWVYYPDRTPAQVADFTARAKKWIESNPDATTHEKLLLIYAWNELGEGGYISPTKALGDAYLKAVRSALK
jgi:hypothetical protein